MNRFVLPVMLSALLAVMQARAEDGPVFTAPMVHPLGDPGPSPDRSNPGAPPPPSLVIPRGTTPRTSAQELVDVFQQACMLNGGQPEAAADWALNNGFVAAPALSQELAAKLAEPGDSSQTNVPANVFSRDVSADSVMLISSGQPIKCAVMTRRSVDGSRLRAQMERFAADASGQKTAQSVMSMNLGGDSGPNAARLVGYKFADGDKSRSLMVMAPAGVGKGIAFLALSVDAAKAPR
jgi:hypothetical protein